MVPIREIADQGVKENDETGSECRNEEEHLGFLRHLSSSEITSTAYQIQHGQSGQAHGSIELGSP